MILDLNEIEAAEWEHGEAIMPPEPRGEPINLACVRDQHHLCNRLSWNDDRDEPVDCACACHAAPPAGEEEVAEW